MRNRFINVAVLVYVVMASIWIVVSDQLLNLLVADVQLNTQLQTIKGWFFVLVSSVALYLALQINAQPQQIATHGWWHSQSERVKASLLGIVLLLGFYLSFRLLSPLIVGHSPRVLLAAFTAMAVLLISLGGVLVWLFYRHQHLRVLQARANLAGYYSALSRTNQAIVRMEEQNRLFQEICLAIVEETGVSGAAIHCLQPLEGLVRVAVQGETCQHGLLLKSGPDGHPAVQAMRDDCMVVCNELSAEQMAAWEMGQCVSTIRSIVAFPLRQHGKVVAVLTVYGLHPAYFDAPLLSLLGELAGDVSFALDNLQRAQQLLLAEKVLEQAREAMMVTRADGVIVAVNPRFTEITGYSANEVIGRTPKLLSSGRQDAEFYQTMWQTLKDEGRWLGEIWNRRRDGSVFPEWLSINSVCSSHGELEYYVATFDDLSERKETEATLERLANYDALTGLPNRLLLQGRLEQACALAQRNDEMLAVMCLGLDRFKQVNDSFGYELGNRLLCEVADRLDSKLRNSDTLSRTSGDEFLIILPGIERADAAAQMAQKLLELVEIPYPHDKQEFSITASIGIALFPNDSSKAEQLIQQANSALHLAKQGGRNTYRFYTPDFNQQVAERLLLVHQLRRGLEQGEFFLCYQPQVALPEGRLLGVEALLRWRKPDEGEMSPASFIPLAEESGLIVPIGRWVLHEACCQAMRWRAHGLQPCRMAVNLSAIQFEREHIPSLVESVLAETGLEPHYLELEVTESVLMGDLDRVLQQLRELKQIGVSLSIDDFGTGYSSLSYLKHFAVDRLKIDQSFVRDLPEDQSDLVLCRAIVGLAQALGLIVIAEGVETEVQANCLHQLGCQEGQGYLFGRPLTAEALLQRYLVGSN